MAVFGVRTRARETPEKAGEIGQGRANWSGAGRNRNAPDREAGGVGPGMLSPGWHVNPQPPARER